VRKRHARRLEAMQQVIDASELTRVRAAAAQLHLSLTAVQAQQLLDYLGLLQRWNAVHNLSGLQSKEKLLVRLVLDSLTVAAALARYAEGRHIRVLDVGSGSGFPAAAIAVARPSWDVAAVDSVSKKAAFIQQAAAESGIANLRAVGARVEGLSSTRPFDVIVSKAFGSLRALVVSTERVLLPGGVWVAQKGKYPAGEIAELPSSVEVFHVEPVTVPGLDEDRCLVWLRRRAS
jgi:16S rRNA (guanine527-N7)-methyltransferase